MITLILPFFFFTNAFAYNLFQTHRDDRNNHNVYIIYLFLYKNVHIIQRTQRLFRLKIILKINLKFCFSLKK